MIFLYYSITTGIFQGKKNIYLLFSSRKILHLPPLSMQKDL